MRVRTLLFVSLAAFGVVALPAAPARALLIKVSINFGPTVTGPDDGTLIVTANPGDYLRITWALGTDASGLFRYDGLISPVDTTEISRVGGSALELTGQGFDPIGNPTPPILGSSAISRPRTGLRSASPGTVVSSGGSTTSSRRLLPTRRRT